MRFHWYWPFARPEELDWARATVRPGEEIIVQVIDREHAPPAGNECAVRVIRDLPDVDRSVNGARWILSRFGTYRTRSVARRRVWETEDVDLVHLHYLNRFTDAVVRLPRPLVMSVHDVVPHVPRLGAPLERRVLRRLYRRGDGLVVHHERLRDKLASGFGIERDHIFVVPHQVFPVDGEVGPPPIEGSPNLLFFGALRPNKGLEVLAEAMELLAGVDLRLTIAGRGDSRLEQVARDLADRDHRLTAELGFVTLERKRELLTQANLVVLPYTSFASQSGVLHDAYGHGRPVVVTDVGALGDAVRVDGTGIVTPPSDAAALADAIRRAITSDEAAGWAQRAREIAQERSPAAVGVRLREVYDVVLGS